MKSSCYLSGEWSVGETILGRYEVRDMFEGGMGKVFRVFDLEWGREMAVKIPHQRLLTRPEIKKSFEEECLTWINMGLHPNIAPCHYIKTVGQNFCIFSEFITGGSLLDLIRSRRLYHENSSEESVRRIVAIAIQIARGLEHAHNKKVIHCDVKPANTLIAADGTVMITDFGLAKACNSHKLFIDPDKNSPESIFSSSGGLTPAYCAPEQVSGGVVTRRTDIWGWAVTVLEMLAGSVFWPDGRHAMEALTWVCSCKMNNMPLAASSIPKNLLFLLAFCFKIDEAGRPKSFSVIEKALRDIYRDLAGREYDIQKPDPIHLDAPSLNNKAVSLIELERTERASDKEFSALAVFRELKKKFHDYATGAFNNLLYEWRELSLPVEELNRCSEQLHFQQSDESIPFSKVLLELEKMDFFRAAREFSTLPGNFAGKQKLQLQITGCITKMRDVLENFFNSPAIDFRSRMQAIVAEVLHTDLSLENLGAIFSIAKNGSAILLNATLKQLNCIDLKSLDLKWQIRLDKNYVRVAISENAELVALATLTRSKVDQTSVYSISILSGKDGSFISSLKEREISGHEPLHAMTIDDAGRRISLWWSFGNSIFEGVHDLDDGRLIPYKLDFRKPSGFNYFSRVIVDGSARFLLFQNGSCFSLWQNLSGEPHQDKLFNLFNIDLADYAIKTPATRDYLPGFEPVIDYSEQLSEEKLYELLSVLLSARTGTTVRYLVCEPSDVKNLLQKQDLKKEFLRKAQNEEQNGNLNAALMIYSDIVNLGGIQQEEILCKRHKILQKLGNSKVLKCWHERTHDYYWQSNMFGLAWFNERLLMQSHGMLAAAEMPDLRPDSSRLFRWVPPQNEVMIGVGSYKDNFLIYSHETEAPYLNKLSLCRLEGHDLKEIGCLAYDAAPEWVWPLDKIAIIGSILFAEVRPGKLVRIDIAEGFSPREITLRNHVQFLKAVTVGGNACLCIAFAKKGLLLLAPDCRELKFPWSGEQEFERLRIAAVSDDFSTVVYWKNGNLVVKNLRTQTTMNIWDQLICGNPLGFRPDLISVSPEGGAVAYIDIHKLIVKCSKTGKEVLSWYGQWPRPIKAIVFDGSSRWLLAITGTNTVEQFQLFWH